MQLSRGGKDRRSEGGGGAVEGGRGTPGTDDLPTTPRAFFSGPLSPHLPTVVLAWTRTDQVVLCLYRPYLRLPEIGTSRSGRVVPLPIMQEEVRTCRR